MYCALIWQVAPFQSASKRKRNAKKYTCILCRPYRVLCSNILSLKMLGEKGSLIGYHPALNNPVYIISLCLCCKQIFYTVIPLQQKNSRTITQMCYSLTWSNGYIPSRTQYIHVKQWNIDSRQQKLNSSKTRLEIIQTTHKIDKISIPSGCGNFRNLSSIPRNMVLLR